LNLSAKIRNIKEHYFFCAEHSEKEGLVSSLQVSKSASLDVCPSSSCFWTGEESLSWASGQTGDTGCPRGREDYSLTG